MSVLKTTFLMAVLTVLLVLAGAAFGGEGGAIFAFILALGINFVTYWFSDKIVLKMYGAKQVTEAEAPELYAICRTLASRAGIPMPRLYLIDSPSPNAFATGRNPQHAAVAATSGILSLLNRDELTGVLAHELSHVIHRDILIGTVAAALAGAISMLANMAQWSLFFGGGDRDEREGNPFGAVVGLLMIILAPLAAMLVQMAISRSREYHADEGGARVSGNPLWLASALRKLQEGAKRLPLEANPATAHLFIVSPLTGEGLMGLFSTHPPLEERIARLEAMAYHRPG